MQHFLGTFIFVNYNAILQQEENDILTLIM